MFNSATNTNTAPNSAVPTPTSPKNSFLTNLKKAAKTTASAAKSFGASAKSAAQTTKVASGNIASMVKQATSSVSETKYLKSQSKIDSAFDLKSPDSENYKFDVRETDLKQGKGVDQKLFSCLVHISCENAKILKDKLQRHICAANQEHNELDIQIKNLQSTLQSINSLGNGKYYSHFTKVNSEVTSVAQKIDELRLKQRSTEITLVDDQQIPVYITVKGYTDLNDAKITKISPGVGKFTISYTDAKGAPQVLSGIDFGKLCVGSGEGLQVKDPSKGCDLPNVDCPLKGGKRKTSKKGSKKGSKKSKKSRKMIGGGDLDSISTNSLC